MNRIELADGIANMMQKSRAEAGKSQEYIAKALGVSRRTIQNWETGDASPNFRVIVEWFDVLGVPMYPYIMSLLYPEEVEGISAETSLRDLKKILHTYVDELDEWRTRELLYLLYGSHGSSPTGTLDVITAYLHLPLFMRICITEHVLTDYEVASSCGILRKDGHIMPKIEALEKFVASAKGAVMSGKESYTITEVNNED